MRVVLAAGMAVLLAASWFPARAAAHGSLHEQIATLTDRIAKDPANAALYLRRGELHGHHRDWDAAMADYDRAARLDPTLDVVDLVRGKTLLHAESHARAKSALDRFLAKHPEHPEALVTRARVLVVLGQRPLAATDYTRAIAATDRRGRPSPEYYLERARALTAEGDGHVDEALQGLDEGIGRLGPIISLQLLAIQLELAAKRYDAALTRLDTLAVQSARKESWLARRGEILEQAGRPAEARLAYEEALAAIASLSARHRTAEATSTLEARIRVALARAAALGRTDR